MPNSKRHSAGEWHVNSDGEILANGRVIAILRGKGDHGVHFSPEDRANGRLIARLPELLERFERITAEVLGFNGNKRRRS